MFSEMRYNVRKIITLFNVESFKQDPISMITYPTAMGPFLSFQIYFILHPHWRGGTWD